MILLQGYEGTLSIEPWFYLCLKPGVEYVLVFQYGFRTCIVKGANMIDARLRNFPADLVRWRGSCIIAPHKHEISLSFPVSFSIPFQPLIEWSVASELAIFILKANPYEHPDERFD